jgi:hypothetical protein
MHQVLAAGCAVIEERFPVAGRQLKAIAASRAGVFLFPIFRQKDPEFQSGNRSKSNKC